MTMIAHTSIDKCSATGVNNTFNFDGVHRDTLSYEECMANLNFEISVKQSYDETGRVIPSLCHLQDNEGNFIPCRGVSPSFTPVQHKDVVDYIYNDIIPYAPEMTPELCGTIRSRSTGLFAAKWGNTFSVDGDESENNLRLFFSNPTNGTGTLTFGFTFVRVICQNTLIAATKEARRDGWKIQHTISANYRIGKAVEQIAAQAKIAQQMKNRIMWLADRNVNRATLEECLDRLYPLKSIPKDTNGYTRMVNLRNRVIDQFESDKSFKKDNAWKLFNSFTFPIFNPDEDKLAKRKTADKADIAFLGMSGNVAEKVAKIFDTVERVAVA